MKFSKSMTSNRIQKLLFSEYSDFEDIVLVESPFAETSKYGRGVRQIQMGLTPTKLILASYNIDSAENLDLVIGRTGRLDPDIESFELISAYPVECVNLSVFRKTKRHTVKARFCNGKVLYLELGGWQERKILWEMWCDRIKFLSPSELSSTVSETSVATSPSSSTLYITRSSLSVTKSGKSQLWCHYSKSNDSLKTEGSNRLECPRKTRKKQSFSDGNLKTPLPFQRNRAKIDVVEEYDEKMRRLADEAVLVWEKNLKTKRGHFRRFGFTPKSHFMYGLGCWSVSSGDAFSVQVKRVMSAVNISCEPRDETLLLPLPRQLLKASVSCDNLAGNDPSRQRCTSEEWSEHYKKRPSVLFWTPGYQYRPRSKRAAYRLMLNQLRSFKGYPPLVQEDRIEEDYWQVWDVSMKDLCNTNSLSKQFYGNSNGTVTGMNCHYPFYAPITKRSGLYAFLSQETVCLHEALTLNVDLTLWDFNTIILAHQLTMIDRHLVLKIPTEELGILLKQKCIQNAPNFLALVSFSYRITCLVATHVVRCVTIKNRARIIIKFVKVASFCDVLRNMQTAKNVLCGLQCPAVYRLKDTWTYVRKHYYTKYSIFVDLCRRYKDPRLPLFQKTYNKHTASPPSIPCVSHIIALLLNKMTQFNPKCSRCVISDNVYKWRVTDISESKAELPKSLRRFYSAFQIYQIPTGLSEHNNLSAPCCCNSGECVCSCSAETITSRLGNAFVSTTKSRHKSQVLENVERFLIASQEAALNYGFKTNFLAKEFLLKAQYKEDQDNFFLSMKIECNNVDMM